MEAARRRLEELRLAPRTQTLVAEVEAIVGEAGDAPLVAIAACAALVAAAELRAPDEPLVADGPAVRAVRLAERALAKLDAAARRDAEVAGYLLVNLATALRLGVATSDARVVALYEEALALDASRGGWWLALAVHHKWELRFADGLAAALRARTLLGDERRVLWNVAICATGAGKGDVAVEALRALGIDATQAASGMPWVDGLPPVEVRLRTRATGLAGDPVPGDSESFEVVAIAPLSPCHGVVASPTLRDAAADYGDVLLWDVAPVAIRHDERSLGSDPRPRHDERSLGSDPRPRPIPCFPALAVLRRGDERRFRFVAREQRDGDVAALVLPGDAQLFVQHVRVDYVCARCAAGESLLRHEHLPPDEHRVVRGKIVVAAATELATFRNELDALLRAHPGVALVVPELHEALGDTRAAGKAHTAWAGIERTAARVVS